MASRKRRENMPQRHSQRGQAQSADVAEVIKHDVDGMQNPFQQPDNSMALGQMSLDVLAQVATATLQNEPKTTATPKKLTKRSVQSLDLLTLEQIRMLSDKALVNMFADMTANEMTRNYTYTCFLMPNECKETFTSFGNENRARMRVRAHLLGHIGELLKESSSGQGRGRIKFTAEPLPARRKRLAGPYPPMPKSELARRGKVVVPEEEMSSSEEDAVELPPKRVRETRRVIEGSAEWERKMALKCIRELRCKKKEATLLLCKICRDKSFTATATLMYHYRSHAGIKPFVCLICNTTFTRQHSLNYHMLIHNNQSRFTCKDCGRKFRHPSHFKEHLRRHTGETPFHCTDCPLRFKTRNTYKRHLKTRHGKLLTAKGIRQMAYEDYLKVRSKRKQQSGGMISEEEDADIEEEDLDEEEDDVESGDVEGNSSSPVDNAVNSESHAPPNRLLQFCRQVAQVS